MRRMKKNMRRMKKKWAQDDKKRSQTPKPPKPPRPAKVTGVVPPTPPSPPVAGSHALPQPPAAPPTPPRINGSVTFNEGNSVNVHVENGKDHTDKISAELLKDGLVSNTTNLSFSLDKNSMIVNGVKQNERVHQKYQKKYLENVNQSMSYVRVDKVTKN